MSAQKTPPVKAGHSVLRDIQAQRIEAAIQAAGGNLSKATRALGVSRNTIYHAL